MFIETIVSSDYVKSKDILLLPDAILSILHNETYITLHGKKFIDHNGYSYYYIPFDNDNKIIDLFETWSNECNPFDNDKQWKIVIEDDKVTLRMLRYKDPSILTLLESRKCGYVVSFFEKEYLMEQKIQKKFLRKMLKTLEKILTRL